MTMQPSEIWYQLHPQRPVDAEALKVESTLCNNLIEEVQMTIRPVKPAGREPR